MFKFNKLDGEYDKSCVLIRFPKAISDKILEYSNDKISDEDLFQDPDNTKGRENEIHVTVLYGLLDKSPDKVLKGLDENYFLKPLEVSLGKISKFDQEDCDVIKIDIKEFEGLKKMNSYLRDNFEYENKYPDYKPHITLAYVKKGTCDGIVGDSIFEDAKVTIDDLKFSSPDESETQFVNMEKKSMVKVAYAHRQDDSMPILQRLVNKGYDRGVWQLHETLHVKYDICNHLNEKVFDLNKLLEGTQYNAPIFSSSHPNCFCMLICYSTQHPDLEYIVVDWKGSSELGREVDKSDKDERRQDFYRLYGEYEELYQKLETNKYLTGKESEPIDGIYSFDISVYGDYGYNQNVKSQFKDQILELILNESARFGIDVNDAYMVGNDYIISTDAPLTIYQFTKEDMMTVNWYLKDRREDLQGLINDLKLLEEFLIETQDKINQVLVSYDNDMSTQGMVKTEGRKAEYGKAYWIDTKGNLIDVDKTHHEEYACKVLGVSEEETKSRLDWGTSEGCEELMKNGYIRVTVTGDVIWLQTLVPYNHIQTNSEKFLSEYISKNWRCVLSDSKSNYDFTYQDFVENGFNLQKTINQVNRINKKSYYQYACYWISPKGEKHKLDNKNQTHYNYVLHNMELFGLNKSNFSEGYVKEDDYGTIWNRILEDGWIRFIDSDSFLDYEVWDRNGLKRVEGLVLELMTSGRKFKILTVDLYNERKHLNVEYSDFVENDMEIRSGIKKIYDKLIDFKLYKEGATGNDRILYYNKMLLDKIPDSRSKQILNTKIADVINKFKNSEITVDDFHSHLRDAGKGIDRFIKYKLDIGDENYKKYMEDLQIIKDVNYKQKTLDILYDIVLQDITDLINEQKKGKFKIVNVHYNLNEQRVENVGLKKDLSGGFQWVVVIENSGNIKTIMVGNESRNIYESDSKASNYSDVNLIKFIRWGDSRDLK